MTNGPFRQRIFQGVLLVALLTLIPNAHGSADPEHSSQAAAGQPLSNPSGQGNDSGELTLTLPECIKLVREKNERIHSQKLEWQASREVIPNAKSIFEPALSTSYQYQRNKSEYTAEEKSSNASALFGGINDKDERNNIYSSAVQSLLPTGGQVSLGYSVNDFANNFNKESGGEYQTFLGMTLTQPLLKNAGIKTTTTSIHMAEADAHIAFQAYRQNLMEVVLNAASTYFDLFHVQEVLKIRRDSVNIAEKIVRENQERVKTGKMAETEVMEAEAGLLYRQSLALEAGQAEVAVMNSLRNYISVVSADTDDITIVDDLALPDFSADLTSGLQRAFALRPEYLSLAHKIERENIRVAYARNQRFPQVDLKGSYGLNGIEQGVDSSWDRALTRDFESWMVGLELTIPLAGGMKSRSELAAARLRKRQALLELKAAEIYLANAVSTGLKEVESVHAQTIQNREVVRLNQQLLEVELQKLAAGHSTSRDVLTKEEDLLKAREAELNSLINFRKAVLRYQATEGSLLQNYNIDVEEVDA